MQQEKQKAGRPKFFTDAEHWIIPESGGPTPKGRPIEVKQFGPSTAFGAYLDDKWRMDYQMKEDTSGNVVISSLKISLVHRRVLDVFGPVPRGGINAQFLRRLGLGAAKRYGQMVIETQVPKVPDAKVNRSTVRGRPPTRTRAFYEHVSERHRELVKAGDVHPSKTLAAEIGYTRVGMRSVLYRCREMELLSRPKAMGKRAGKTAGKRL